MNPPRSGNRREALVKSQTFMNRHLKASQVNFPCITDSEVKVVHQGGGTFLVRSYVDASNSAGSKTRTHYVYVLQDNGEDNWVLIKLKSSEPIGRQ